MKKKNQDVNPEGEIQHIPLALAFEENPYIQWVSENGKSLIISLLALIALFIIGYRFAFGSMMQAETDFFQADQAFQTFASDATTPDAIAAQEDAFKKLEQVIKRHPELHAKYDGPIAQILISRNSFSEALPYAAGAIQRTKAENEPYFYSYAQNTILIAEKNYNEALKNSVALKTQIANKEPVLFGFNLIRIASLQQQLGSKSEELNAWKEWKQFAASDTKSAQKVINHFKDGDVSITNYIEAREKILKS